ncbi:MAG: polysaccharide biosynthesis C-terminal domain-containing protein [Saprospiraceae bacterium]
MKLSIKKYIDSSATVLQFTNLLRQITLIGTSILLAQSSLSLLEVGWFETYLFIGTSISFFWLSAWGQKILTLKNDTEQKIVLQQIYSLSIITSLFSGFIWLITNVLYHSDFFNLHCFFILYWCINTPTILLDNIFYTQQKISTLINFSVATSLLNLLIIFIGANVLGSLQTIIIGYIFLAIFRSIWANSFWKNWHFDTHLIREIIITTLPLMAYSLLGNIAQISDGILIKYFYNDAAQFAIFRYGARELPLINAFTIGLSNAMVYTISQNNQLGINELKEKSSQLMDWLFPISILLLLTSNQIFTWLFSAKFEQSVPIFNIYLLLIVSRVLFPQSVMLALQKNKVILQIGIIELTFNILLSILLIHKFGLQGIATATVIAFLIEKFLLSIYLQRRLQIPISKYTPVKKWLCWSILLFLIFIIKTL